MTFEELDATTIPVKMGDVSMGMGGTFPLSAPREPFIMVGPDGLAYYARITIDGRIVPLEEDEINEGMWD